MTVAEQVYEQAKLLPEPLAQKALDFVLFLRGRQERGEWRDLMDAQSVALAAVWDNLDDEAVGQCLRPGRWSCSRFRSPIFPARSAVPFWYWQRRIREATSSPVPSPHGPDGGMHEGERLQGQRAIGWQAAKVQDGFGSVRIGGERGK